MTALFQIEDLMYLQDWLAVWNYCEQSLSLCAGTMNQNGISFFNLDDSYSLHSA